MNKKRFDVPAWWFQAFPETTPNVRTMPALQPVTERIFRAPKIGSHEIRKNYSTENPDLEIE